MHRRLTGRSPLTKSLFILTLSSALAFFATPLSGQKKPMSASSASLPDWSGVWEMIGRTTFDQATVEPPGAAAGTPGVRERPPYNPEWEAKYQRNIELVRQDKFPDPLSFCGIPAGFPRIMNLPDTYEFVVRPEQTWILAENGPSIMRIYTDGRGHAPPDELWPTYTGDSVGRWEGGTLVFETIGLKGEDGTIVDRTGVVLSSQMRVVTRMRKVGEQLLEAQLTIYDPVALTRPWVVTKRYRKLPPGSRVYDYACAENNRNPVDAASKTLTLGSDGKPIDVHAQPKKD